MAIPYSTLMSISALQRQDAAFSKDVDSLDLCGEWRVLNANTYPRKNKSSSKYAMMFLMETSSNWMTYYARVMLGIFFLPFSSLILAHQVQENISAVSGMLFYFFNDRIRI